MFHNYGLCAIFLKEKTFSLDVQDYYYNLSNKTVYLKKYIGDNKAVVVPMPTITEGA